MPHHHHARLCLINPNSVYILTVYPAKCKNCKNNSVSKQPLMTVISRVASKLAHFHMPIQTVSADILLITT